MDKDEFYYVSNQDTTNCSFSRHLYVLIDCGNCRLETLRVIAGFSVSSTNTCNWFKTRSSSAEPSGSQQINIELN